MTCRIVNSSPTLVFLSGIPFSVSVWMLLSVFICYGYRVVSPMQIFAERKSWPFHSWLFHSWLFQSRKLAGVVQVLEDNL